jgi:hypothetical protein
MTETSHWENPDCVKAQHHRAGQGDRVDEDRVDPAPVELTVDEQPEQRGVDDTDG